MFVRPVPLPEAVPLDHTARSTSGPTTSATSTTDGFDHVLVDVDVREEPGGAGRGIHVREAVPKGTPLAVFGGRAVPTHVFEQLSDFRRRHALQVHDDVYLVTDETPGTGDYINHSCDPSAVLVGQIVLVARRDLAPGDQITFDYATTDASSYDEFECECGTALCRDKVTANDWMKPELRRRYAGHFSPYIQAMITDLEDLADPTRP